MVKERLTAMTLMKVNVVMVQVYVLYPKIEYFDENTFHELWFYHYCLTIESISSLIIEYVPSILHQKECFNKVFDANFLAIINRIVKRKLNR